MMSSRVVASLVLDRRIVMLSLVLISVMRLNISPVVSALVLTAMLTLKVSLISVMSLTMRVVVSLRVLNFVRSSLFLNVANEALSVLSERLMGLLLVPPGVFVGALMAGPVMLSLIGLNTVGVLVFGDKGGLVMADHGMVLLRELMTAVVMNGSVRLAVSFCVVVFVVAVLVLQGCVVLNVSVLV